MRMKHDINKTYKLLEAQTVLCYNGSIWYVFDSHLNLRRESVWPYLINAKCVVQCVSFTTKAK